MSDHLHHDHDHQDRHDFDAAYWERQWREGHGGAMAQSPPSPYLERELAALQPGTALEAGCGAGAEAIWLAGHGWQVTGADISAEALAHAERRAENAGVTDRVSWVRADLGSWEPPTEFDLVSTHYAHASIPQLDLYDRLASWVAPGGTLLVVGHAHDDTHGHTHGHGHSSPAEASVTAADVAERLDTTEWTVVTAEESRRTHEGVGGGTVTLRDVVVRATRRLS